MKVIFYSRSWTAELHLALERHWRERDALTSAHYITHHLEAAQALRARGARVDFLPEAIGSIPIEDPPGVLERFERGRPPSFPPLMRLLMAERFFVGRDRDWQLDQLARYLVYFEGLFDELRADLLVSNIVDLMAGWLAHELAPLYGCEPVGLAPSTLPPGRLLLVRRPNEVPGARERYAEIRQRGPSEGERAAARKLQDVVLGSGTRVDYLPATRDWGDFARRLATGSIMRDHIALSAWGIRERRAGNWFVQPDQFAERARQPFRAARGRFADTTAGTDPPPSRPYAFFPLHFEPEAGLLVQGSYFEDQITTIRNVARSLPAHWELAVKEHPAMRGRRALQFYRRLRAIPNVRLQPSTVPSNQLIKGARVTALINSTVGLEAALIGKPVVMFGDFPWEYAPTIHKVQVLSDLPELILEADGDARSPEDPDVVAFGASWDASLPEGRYYRHREYDWLEPANVAAIARALEAAVERAPVGATG